MAFSEQNCRQSKKRRSYCPVESEMELSTGGSLFFSLMLNFLAHPLEFVPSVSV